MSLPRLLCAVLFSLACLFAAATPAAADGAKVMLVLDASGSMWGKVGDITKIEAARQTVAAILQDWRPEDQLGLVVYGHRQKGECGDIEVMKPVGPVDKAEFLAQIGAISPKGRTPMTEAVRRAAEALKSVEGKASVILVSDGIETCNADPCAVAASLKKADVDLVIHTVGFDIQDPEASRQLSCMAQATGGLALTAADAKDLTKAIQEAVFTAQKDAPTPAPEPEPPAKVVTQEAAPEWNLTGYARLAANDDPLLGKEDIRWEFYKPAPEGVTPDYVNTTYNPNIHIKLEPGDYIVTTHVGAAEVKNKISIAPGRMNQLDVVLNAGRIGLRAKRTETENQTGDVRWEVYAKGGDTNIYTSYNAETSTIIPAGEYTVTMTLGAAKVTRDLEVTPGETTAIEIVAGVGKLKGKITFSPGGPVVKDTYTEIYSGAEPVDNESPIASSYESEPVFDVPAGTYRVNIRAGGAKRSFPLVVKPGDKLEAAWALDAGLAAFDAPGAEGVIITGTEADIYGEVQEITRLYTLPGQYVLPTGHYKATAYRGDIKVEAEFDVKPGQRTQTKLALPN